MLHTESCKISNLEFYFLGQIRFKTESISNAFAAPVCTYSRKINNLQGGRIEEGAFLNLQEQEYAILEYISVFELLFTLSFYCF